MRWNKDENGFTDEAIEAVEYELTQLAEQIGVTEEELGERIADDTHRQSFNLIEVEIATMRSVAIDMVHERVKRWQAQVRNNLQPMTILMLASILCGGIAILFVVRSWRINLSMPHIWVALVYAVLLIMTTLAAMQLQVISEALVKAVATNIDLAEELLDSAREVVDSSRGILMMPDGRVTLIPQSEPN